MGDCHYLDGNVKAEHMFNTTKDLITTLGIPPERIRLEWISSSEGVRFAEVIRDFTSQIKALGPSPLREAA